MSINKSIHETSSDPVDDYLSRVLRETLASFPSQPHVWVDPIISEKSETEEGANEAKRYSISELIIDPIPTVIHAPAQFGLSSLARSLSQQAWRVAKQRWVCLDVQELRPTKGRLKRAINSDLKQSGQQNIAIECIVLDSWRASDQNAIEILKIICKDFSEIPVFVMQTVDSQAPISLVTDEEFECSFRVLYLWSLPRERIRSVVSDYLEQRNIGDEDIVTARVVSDIDTLNLHRTPLSCLTVLKASEMDFDENPVNRTEILHRVLFILFNVDAIPRYKTRPDMKDCEHALGYFVENLIKSNPNQNNFYTFTKEHFISTIKKFCKTQVIAIDSEILFNILHESYILILSGSECRFRFTAWLYYFAAHRMHHDKEFANFILSDMQYIRFPEIIEFYTGVDRRREDAVKVLAMDVLKCVADVREKWNLTIDLNLLPKLEWQPSPEGLEMMQAEIKDGIADSNLPAIVKDRYEDRGYSPSRPYDQSIREVIANDTVYSLMLITSAASRALRNSDYVDPRHRENLLKAILESWRQISQILFAIYPLLAERGHASFDGIRIVLASDFGNDPAERLHRVLTLIPYNVVNWHQDDLYSPKMALLLSDYLSQEIDDDLIRHEMMLLLIAKRPQGWKNEIQRYIGLRNKNSFYLFDIYSKLREQYRYAFVDSQELKNLEYLIKMVGIKHFTRMKKPTAKAIRKISDSVLPERKVEGQKIIEGTKSKTKSKR